MARAYYRKEGSVEFIASTHKTLELSRNYHVMRYVFELTLNVTNESSGVVYYNNNLFNLFDFTLTANGGVNIKQIPAEKLIYNSIINEGRETATEINTASGDKVLKQTAYLDLILSDDFLNPLDTVLNTKVFDTLNLEIEWHDKNALGTGFAITSGKLDVSSMQLVGFKRSPGEYIKYNKEVATTKKLTTDSNALQVIMPVQQLYRGFLLVVKKNNVLTNDVLKNIILKSGTTVFADLRADTLQRINESEFRFDSIVNNKGLYYLDFTVRSKLSDMLNTVISAGGFNTLEFIFDVEDTEGASDLIIFPEYIDITNQVEA
jgi:hypothetical protein